MASRFKKAINDDSIWETLKNLGVLPSIENEMASEIFADVCKVASIMDISILL